MDKANTSTGKSGKKNAVAAVSTCLLWLSLVQTLIEFAEKPDILAGFVRLSDQR
ncbi:hypothetical protein [Scytonema sp. PRP1]|uniref:hypothetical protein n=1 Tax=Scytonema sp. PRP1 TaxID=3120513 RepID=UPI00300D3DA0